MSTPSQLLSLVTRLKACPSRDGTFSEKALHESWACFRKVAPEHGDEITPAMIAGLILYDEEQFAQLLNEAERSQMIALSKVALERFREKTNPPNKLGKIIAAALKEST